MTVVITSGLTGRINELAKSHGSLRAAARVLGVDAGYLCRLRDGKKLKPSDRLLRKLKLRRVVYFARTSTTIRKGKS